MTITEEWARTAPVGPELDRVCAEWMAKNGNHWSGWQRGLEAFSPDEPREFSTDWSAAGPLLEAMGVDVEFAYDGVLWVVSIQDIDGPRDMVGSGAVHAPTPQLAIARACAVLVARRITREHLRGDL